MADAVEIRVRSVVELLESQEFIAAAAFGAAVVAVDAWRRYNEVAFRARPGDVIAEITPRFLATNADYVNGFAVYVALRLLAYLLPALAILHIFSDKGMVDALGVALPDYFRAFISHENFPLFWAAVVAGVLPTFSFVRDVEEGTRRFAHLTGAIPTGVKELAALLRAVRLRPNGSFDRARLRTERFAFVAEADFVDADQPIARKWARAAFILDYFFDRHSRAYVQDAFFAAYRDAIEREDARFRSLQIRYAIHKAGYDRAKAFFAEAGSGDLPRTISAEDPFLEADIDALLDRLEIYLAVALRHDENDDARAYEKLRALGFALPETPPQRSGPVGGVLATLVALVAAAFVGAVTADGAVSATSTLGLTVFPESAITGDSVMQRAFYILVYTLFVVSSVLLGSFLVGRTLFKIRADEVDARPMQDKPLVSYALASLLGAAFGLIATTAIVIDVVDPSGGGSRWVLYWTPSFVVLGFMIHLFAYGPSRGLWRLLAEAAIIGAAFGVATYFSALSVYSVFDYSGPRLDGVALYYAINAFWTGLFASAAIIFVHRLQRDRAARADGRARPEAAAETP